MQPDVRNAQPARARKVGEHLREWRTRRRRSQMDLALDVGVSTRHLSFIETGRAKPSPAMLDALADALEVPLRERNVLLLAAGYAPRYTALALDAECMGPVRSALERLLQAHDPYPGLVLDRLWNVVLANRSAQALTAVLPAHLTAGGLNVFRASLHPEGLAAFTANFAEWATYLLQTLRRHAVRTGDPALWALEREVLAYPNVASLPRSSALDGAGEQPQLLLPCLLRLPQGPLSMFTTLTSFGIPVDITLAELSVELFYPADEESRSRLQAWDRTPPA